MPPVKKQASAPQKPAQRAWGEAEPERSYHIVNPAGAIHSVSREHAAERLKTPGWRMATRAELAKLEAQDGNQRWDRPIARPWAPDPDAQIDPDEPAPEE